jgi:predicted NBD/HSP70 family sugar kinase
MYFVFDIGGTKMRLGVAESGSIKKSQIVDTPQDFNQAVELIKTTLPSLADGQEIEAAAGGLPGILNQNKAILFRAPNLPEWEEKPIKDTIQGLINGPLFLENDASLNGLGEASFGAGKSFGVVGYIGVGTGLGGARIVDQKIDKSAFGFEPGKQIIQTSPLSTLEELVSGKAIEKKFGKSSEEIDDPEFWDEVAKYLAAGLNNVIVHWSPEVIVLGG